MPSKCGRCKVRTLSVLTDGAIDLEARNAYVRYHVRRGSTKYYLR
jgi:hypothetical protein